MEEPTNADLREWGNKNGFLVAKGGPIPNEVKEAYKKSHK